MRMGACLLGPRQAGDWREALCATEPTFVAIRNPCLFKASSTPFGTSLRTPRITAAGPAASGSSSRRRSLWLRSCCAA